jgi:hypothetical protein
VYPGYIACSDVTDGQCRGPTTWSVLDDRNPVSTERVNLTNTIDLFTSGTEHLDRDHRDRVPIQTGSGQMTIATR